MIYSNYFDTALGRVSVSWGGQGHSIVRLSDHTDTGKAYLGPEEVLSTRTDLFAEVSWGSKEPFLVYSQEYGVGVVRLGEYRFLYSRDRGALYLVREEEGGGVPVAASPVIPAGSGRAPAGISLAAMSLVDVDTKTYLEMPMELEL